VDELGDLFEPDGCLVPGIPQLMHFSRTRLLLFVKQRLLASTKNTGRRFNSPAQPPVIIL